MLFLKKINDYANNIESADDYNWFEYSIMNACHEKLKAKGIILRSTEYGYKIKNRLRLTIGSRNDNLKFMRSVERIFGE